MVSAALGEEYRVRVRYRIGARAFVGWADADAGSPFFGQSFAPSFARAALYSESDAMECVLRFGISGGPEAVAVRNGDVPPW